MYTIFIFDYYSKMLEQLIKIYKKESRKILYTMSHSVLYVTPFIPLLYPVFSLSQSLFGAFSSPDSFLLVSSCLQILFALDTSTVPSNPPSSCSCQKTALLLNTQWLSFVCRRDLKFLGLTF